MYDSPIYYFSSMNRENETGVLKNTTVLGLKDEQQGVVETQIGVSICIQPF